VRLTLLTLLSNLVRFPGQVKGTETKRECGEKELYLLDTDLDWGGGGVYDRVSTILLLVLNVKADRSGEERSDE
jgi:hypothetical protein